jgi:glycerol-1-phosphate dehydrogenase [NAD(P)+]
MIAPGAALHGEQCGLGTIMMAKLHGLDWEVIRNNLATIGAPTTADELSIDGEILVEALVKAGAIRPERYTILNKVNLSRKSARKLAENTCVI